jgi:CHASE2 domain-containing sensor protein
MPKRRPKVPTFAIGFVITVIVLGLYWAQWGFLESIELKTFDLRTRLNQPEEAPPTVVIVSIDDESIAKMGRWPWPRSIIARMIDLLTKSGAKVIGVDILFSEPEKNQGLREIQRLKEVLLSRSLERRRTKEMVEFLRYLREAEANLDNDSKLISSVEKAGNVILPMYFTTDSPLILPGESLPPYLEKHTLNHVTKTGEEDVHPIVQANNVTAPISGLATGSAGIGHINRSVDVDGATRWEILVIKYGKWYYPSFSLQIVMRYLNVRNQGSKIILGEGIDLSGLLIPAE